MLGLLLTPRSRAHVLPSQALRDVMKRWLMGLTLISRLERSICACTEGFVLLAELCERFSTMEIASDTLMLVFVLNEIKT